MEDINKNLDIAKQVVKMLETQVKFKYPKGSTIVFTGQRKPDEVLATVSCSWYNTGGKGEN